ncbi:hypothetical protein LWI28_028614 [Acer negundo]|uniref:Uncharacterized protein n=1 Tax=Acer negundo TaxID=4023 RepID=A0AAD5II07_ACENE|nr:hypothetical protein LWI28_028614 [Acer negundo]
MASAFFYIPTINALPNHNRIPFTSPKLATKLQVIHGGNSPILTEKTLLQEFSIEDYRTKTLRKIHKALDEAVPLQYPTALHKAMRYTILAGKERFFPTICFASGELVGGDESSVMAMACAIEMVNTVGLVLDDLPCMDNDDLRRGKTASHKVFGEATTILACNALMCLAADHLITKTKHVVSPNHLFEATVEMYSAFGSKGCTAGQIADMDSEGKELSLAELEFIHNHKTGRLIEAAAVCGVLIGGGNEVEVERVRRFGKNVGLAFQVWDDILDEIGSTEKLGKKVGRDLLRKKATYPKLIGMDESKKFARELVAKAHEELTYFDSTKAAPMYHLANFVVNRHVLSSSYFPSRTSHVSFYLKSGPGTMDFYEQHAYDKESEVMNELVMKLIVVQQQMWDLKPMILARKQVGQPISPSLEEEFNNLPQSIQQAWDEATNFPSYHKIVERCEFFDDFSSVEDEEEETEENVKEEDEAPFEAPLLYKELQPYVPLITLPSQPEQEEAITIPYYVQEELSISVTPLILPTHVLSRPRQTDQDPVNSPVPCSFQDVGVDARSGSQLPVQIPLPPPAPKMSLGLHLPISTPSVLVTSVSTPPSVLLTLIPPHPKLSTMLAHAARALSTLPDADLVVQDLSVAQRVQQKESIPLIPQEFDFPAANPTMIIEVVHDTHADPEVQQQNLTSKIEAIQEEDVARGPEIPCAEASQTSTEVTRVE